VETAGSAFELASLTPHIERNLADEVFRNLFVPHEPKPETKHPDMVPSVQHLHAEPVALSDPERSGHRPMPLVSHSMAVSQGWSHWIGGWFDCRGKILQIIPIGRAYL